MIIPRYTDYETPEEVERQLLKERIRKAVREGLDFLREHDPLWYQLILSDHKERL